MLLLNFHIVFILKILISMSTYNYECISFLLSCLISFLSFCSICSKVTMSIYPSLFFSVLESLSYLFLVYLRIHTYTHSYMHIGSVFHLTLFYKIGSYYAFFSVSCFSCSVIISRTSSKSASVALSHSFNGCIKYGIIYEITPWCSWYHCLFS